MFWILPASVEGRSFRFWRRCPCRAGCPCCHIVEPASSWQSYDPKSLSLAAPLIAGSFCGYQEQQLTEFKLFLISTRFQGILYCSKMDSSATIIWSLGIFINSSSIPNSIHSHCYFTSFMSNWWAKLENSNKIKYDNCQLAEWVRIWFGFFHICNELKRHLSDATTQTEKSFI